MHNDSKLIFEAYKKSLLSRDDDKEFDTFLNTNLSNALTPIKELNTSKAVKFLNNRISELTKKRIVLGPGEPPHGPFYIDDSNGNAMVLLSVVGNDPMSSVQPRQDFKVRIDPDLDNSPKKLTRAVNIAVNEFLRGDDENSESQKSEPEINSRIEGILNKPKTNVDPQAGQPYEHKG